jgi:GTPase
VEQVLAMIDADKVPQILVFNKIDLSPNITPKIDRDENGVIKKVFVSAYKNLGLAELTQAISELLSKDMIEKQIILTPKQGRLRANLYKKQAVLLEEIDDDGNYHLTIRLPRIELEKLFH